MAGTTGRRRRRGFQEPGVLGRADEVAVPEVARSQAGIASSEPGFSWVYGFKSLEKNDVPENPSTFSEGDWRHSHVGARRVQVAEKVRLDL